MRSPAPTRPNRAEWIAIVAEANSRCCWLRERASRASKSTPVNRSIAGTVAEVRTSRLRSISPRSDGPTLSASAIASTSRASSPSASSTVSRGACSSGNDKRPRSSADPSSPPGYLDSEGGRISSIDAGACDVVESGVRERRVAGHDRDRVVLYREEAVCRVSRDAAAVLERDAHRARAEDRQHGLVAGEDTD